jgi:hypothetical protein
MWTSGCSIAHTGEATEILLPTHITSGCHIMTSTIPPSSVDVLKHAHNTEDMSYGHVPSYCHPTSGCHIMTSIYTAWPTADTLNCVCNLSTGYGPTHPDVMCLNDEDMSLRHPPSSYCHQIIPERCTVMFMTIPSTADRLSCVCKLPAPYGLTHPFLMHSHASLGADHCRDSKDMSCGRVSSSSHSAPIVEC